MVIHGRKYFLIVALILSILLHVITLAPVILNISLLEIIATLREKISQLLHPDTPDQILERKKAKSVPKVSLNIAPLDPAHAKKTPDVITIRLIQDIPAPKPKDVTTTSTDKASVKKKNSKPKSEQTSAQQSADDLYTELMNQPTVVAKSPQEELNFDVEEPAPAYDLNQNTLIDNTTVRVIPREPLRAITGTPTAALVATGRKPQQLTNDSAPPFPVEILARYRTSVMGFDFNMYREWHMEGRQYSIVDTTSLLGFKFSAISDGAISEQGLQPKNFTILVNNDINRFATFDRSNMTMSYGKPSKPKKMPFNSTAQDISSIGFQMALAYSDKAQDIQVTAGTGIYTIKMQLIAEEKIRLPVGVIRTLHIHGQTVSGDAAADVWLAPDYRNMPVKVKVSSEGRTLDQSLSSLSIEGTVIFGKKYPPREPENKQSDANTSSLSGTIKQEVEF